MSGSVEERAVAAATEAIKAAEVARRAADKPVSITGTSEGLFMLTETGRLYLRRPDPHHFNDGRTAIKYGWIEVEGPGG